MAKPLTVTDCIERLNIEALDAGYRKFHFDLKKTITHKGDACLGLTDFEDTAIALTKDMKPDTAREVLLHEIIHVVLETVGLGGAEEDDSVTTMTNEEMTTLISRGLLLVMNLNPKLFKLILTPSDNLCEMIAEEDGKTN